MFQKLLFPSREAIISIKIHPALKRHCWLIYTHIQTRQDCKIFRKVSNAKGHPLLSIMPRVKPSSYNLRKETRLKINTMCFKNPFINRLVFKYEFAM